jgi:hypothetical protein
MHRRNKSSLARLMTAGLFLSVVLIRSAFSADALPPQLQRDLDKAAAIWPTEIAELKAKIAKGDISFSGIAPTIGDLYRTSPHAHVAGPDNCPAWSTVKGALEERTMRASQSKADDPEARKADEAKRTAFLEEQVRQGHCVLLKAGDPVRFALGLFPEATKAKVAVTAADYKHPNKFYYVLPEHLNILPYGYYQARYLEPEDPFAVSPSR